MAQNTEKLKRCEHCGAGMKEYWHALSPGLVNVLVKMIASVKRKGENKVHLQRDLDLTKTEYNNFQKLRFHALVAKTGEDHSWLITKRGGQFLRGEIRVPCKVKTFRNHVIDHSEQLVGMPDYRNKVSWFESDFVSEINAIAGERVIQQDLFQTIIS